MASPFTKDETDLLVSAIDQALASARRQQKSGKSPQINAVYAEQEKAVTALKVKVQSLK